MKTPRVHTAFAKHHWKTFTHTFTQKHTLGSVSILSASVRVCVSVCERDLEGFIDGGHYWVKSWQE